MYKGNNPTAKRSQEWISKSLVNLMSKKQLEKITIKEIMENSELSRQTFYQVFDSIEDVLEYHMDTLFLKYLKYCKIEMVNNLCDVAKLFFRFFNENINFVEGLIENKKTYILQKKCQEYLQEEHFLKFTQAGVNNSQEKVFASAFVTSGLVGMLIFWLENGKVMSTDDITKIICRIINTQE